MKQKIILITIISLIMVQTMCNAVINPLVGFEDVTLCNSVGVYKNGNNAFNDENNLLDSLSGSSIHRLVENHISLYPNPASSSITIEYNFTEESNLIIYDLTGRVIIEALLPAKGSKITLDISHLANSIYTYKQSIAGRILNTGKFVKED